MHEKFMIERIALVGAAFVDILFDHHLQHENQAGEKNYSDSFLLVYGQVIYLACFDKVQV